MLEGTIKRVVDGDTIHVNVVLPIRLDFINAPETKGIEREDGIKVREWLQKRLATGDKVQIDTKKQDVYDRFLSVIYKDGVNINGEMLKLGLAEVYTPGNNNNGKMD